MKLYADPRPEWVRMIEEGLHLANANGWYLLAPVEMVTDDMDVFDPPLRIKDGELA